MWPVFSNSRSCLLPPPLGQTSVLNYPIRLTPWKDFLTFGINSISCKKTPFCYRDSLALKNCANFKLFL